MKASELIKVIKKQIEKHGDADVYIEQGGPHRLTHEMAVRSVAMLDPETGEASMFLIIQDNAAALEMG